MVCPERHGRDLPNIEAESLHPLPVDEEMPPIDELATLEEETLVDPTFVVDSSVMHFMKNFALQMQGQTYDTDEEAPPLMRLVNQSLHLWMSNQPMTNWIGWKNYRKKRCLGPLNH